MSVVKDIARKFCDKIEALDFVQAFEMLNENGRYIVIGTTDVSGIYEGRRDALDRLIPVLSRFKVAPRVKFQDPIVDGDRAVLLASGSGEGPTGPYDQPYYAFVTRVSGGGFSQIIEFMDTVMIETAFFGKRLVAK